MCIYHVQYLDIEVETREMAPKVSCFRPTTTPFRSVDGWITEAVRGLGVPGSDARSPWAWPPSSGLFARKSSGWRLSVFTSHRMCIYVCMYVCIYTHIHVNMRVCVYIYICVCVRVYVYVYMCICIYMYIHIIFVFVFFLLVLCLFFSRFTSTCMWVVDALWKTGQP